MLTAILAKSLCATCIHDGACLYQKEDEVVFCDEFESRIDNHDEEMGEMIHPLPVPELNSHAAMGICSTCASVDDCRLSRHRRDVWECEEYR
jgi:hypothetical protein